MVVDISIKLNIHSTTIYGIIQMAAHLLLEPLITSVGPCQDRCRGSYGKSPISGRAGVSISRGMRNFIPSSFPRETRFVKMNARIIASCPPVANIHYKHEEYGVR
jgi:hypothetical protein